jgi:hypothetical protein
MGLTAGDVDVLTRIA